MPADAEAIQRRSHARRHRNIERIEHRRHQLRILVTFRQLDQLPQDANQR